MFDWRSFWQGVMRYANNDDALTEASNRLALILASNQPFYPLYVHWITGVTSPYLGLTFLSTPFFLASPWVTKRFPGFGRLWFPTIGAMNTFFCGFVFGGGSGVEWFFLPCIVIAFLSCRNTERSAFVIYCAILIGAYVILHGDYGGPLFQSESAQTALWSLNAYSGSVLSVVALWVMGRSRFY